MNFATLSLALALLLVSLQTGAILEQQQLRDRIQQSLRGQSKFDFLGTITGGRFTDGNFKNAFDEAGDAFEKLGKNIGNWATGAYEDSENGMKKFLNDAGKGLNDLGNDINNGLISPVDDWMENRVDYFRDGGFVRDMKKVADILKDVFSNICTYPGAQQILKASCSKGLSVGICAATSGAVCGPKNPSAARIVVSKGSNFVIGNAVKCGTFELLKLLIPRSVLCLGRLDFIADQVAIAVVSEDGAFDSACNMAVECACGTCPTTCSYENRVICDGAWWLVNGPAAADAYNSVQREMQNFTSFFNSTMFLNRDAYVALQDTRFGNYLRADTTTMSLFVDTPTYRYGDAGLSSTVHRNTWRLITDSTGRAILYSLDRYRFLSQGPTPPFGSALRTSSYGLNSRYQTLEMVSPGLIRIRLGSAPGGSYWSAPPVSNFRVQMNSSANPRDVLTFRIVELTRGVFNDNRGGLTILKATLGTTEASGIDKTKEVVEEMLKGGSSTYASPYYKIWAGNFACGCTINQPNNTWPMQCITVTTRRVCVTNGICSVIPSMTYIPRSSGCPLMRLYVRYIRNSGPERVFATAASNYWLNQYMFGLADLD